MNIKAIWQIKTLNYIFIIILKNPGLLFDISSEFDYDKSENPGSIPQNFIFPHPLTFHVIFLPSEEFRGIYTSNCPRYIEYNITRTPYYPGGLSLAQYYGDLLTILARAYAPPKHCHPYFARPPKIYT